MRLREVQRLLWRAITWPTGVDDFLAQADPATRAAFASTFAAGLPGSPQLGARERVGVYAESYYWRLEEVLRDQFRVSAWVCGSADFHDLCTDFVLERPSASGDVRRIGAPFPTYVAAHPIARRIRGIEDVACIEWSAVEAIDAVDVPRFGAADLSAVALPDWPALRLHAAPGVSLHRCRLPYAGLWNARERGEPSSPDAPPTLGPPQHVLVWRAGLEVFHRSVGAPESAALAALLDNATFSEICTAAEDAAAASTEPATPATVVAWLRRWLDDGLVAAP